MTDHPVVSREEWLATRKTFLVAEKEFTRQRDEISRRRRTLPWVRVESDYEFDTLGGKQTLAELFGDRSQLIVYHFTPFPRWIINLRIFSADSDIRINAVHRS